MLSRAPWVLLNLIVMSAGCDGCDSAARAVRDAGVMELGSASGAVLKGRVRLAPGRSLPRYAADDLQRPVLERIIGKPPPGCDENRLLGGSPVGLTASGALFGVVVAASGFTTYKPRKSKTHVVTVTECQLSPQLVVAMRGDRLRIRNGTDHPVSPIFGPAPIAAALAPGDKWKFKLDKAGVESIMCPSEARCGRTDVVVMHHPVHTVTDEHGEFVIRDFPIGQTVKVSAWHPLFADSHTYVWLERDQRLEVELVLDPLDSGNAM